MGSKHPISLRLKTKQNWGNTSYYFNSKNEQYNYWGVDKIALNVIKHYFQFALISKPKFNKDSNKVVISFYYFLNLPVSKRLNFGQSKRIQSSLQEGSRNFEAKRFSSLILKLSRFYGKPVELRPIRIHYPYLNSYILAQYIALNIKAGNFNKISRNLFKKAKLVKNNSITNSKTSTAIKNFISYSPVLLNPQYLTGIKIQISGRLSMRKAASRTRVVRKSTGSLGLNSYNTLIDANKFSFKSKNGAATVKVWLSSVGLNSNNKFIRPTNTNTPLILHSNYLSKNNIISQGVRSYSTNINKELLINKIQDNKNSMNNNISFIPAIIYSNADINKLTIINRHQRENGDLPMDSY